MVDLFPMLLIMVLICCDLRIRTFATAEGKFEVTSIQEIQSLSQIFEFGNLQIEMSSKERVYNTVAIWLVILSSHLVAFEFNCVWKEMSRKAGEH